MAPQEVKLRVQPPPRERAKATLRVCNREEEMVLVWKWEITLVGSRRLDPTNEASSSSVSILKEEAGGVAPRMIGTIHQRRSRVFAERSDLSTTTNC
mmetsp:Transcript_2566/g.7140  ORF Transcript_2566/g.7140 Transcript_2566/m.7140 type:complete len:97 (+) Transcript_2566:424-714(+)